MTEYIRIEIILPTENNIISLFPIFNISQESQIIITTQHREIEALKKRERNQEKRLLTIKKQIVTSLNSNNCFSPKGRNYINIELQ